VDAEASVGEAASPLKALIIDDHSIARRGLAQILRSAFEIAEITGAGDGATALEAVRKTRPDLIVMDLEIPGRPRGSVLCAQLRHEAPAADIVVVTAFDRGGEIKQCLAAGANGALLKETTDSDLVGALRRIRAGEMVISPAIAARMANDLVGILRGSEAVVALTDREREVLDLLREGCSNREISQRLVLSEATVKDHVGGLMRKLEATSRLQVVVKAMEAGLI